MLEIQRKVPIPALNADRPVVRRKYPFEDMEIDDMFFVPDETENRLASYASHIGKRLGRKFSTRLCWMLKTPDEGWVPAAKGVTNAVQGIGVWRTE